ncbi:MAG TPA: site-2 protease family protein [Tepidisphaeraceae bacterium]|jgi:Zn-dependent protease|nr:site-2 protease family protein [Tepidisphaeraceae bacterium]
MFGRSFRLPFKLLGIPVFVDLSFLLVLPLLAWIIGSQIGEFAKMFGLANAHALSTGVEPYVLGLIAAIGLFVSVVIHELGHAVTARAYGVQVRRITLWFLGGVAQFEDMPRQPGAEAIVAIVGPLVSFAIGAVCWWLERFVPPSASPARFIVGYLVYMNIVLAIFNLIPAMPLDGGRVLRSLLALWMPRLQATQIAAGVSKVLAALLGVVGLFSLNFWLLLIAIFIYMSVGAETRFDQFEAITRGLLVRDLMNPDVHAVPPEMHVSELLDHMLRQHHLGFPVVNPSGAVVGMVTLRQVQGKPPQTAVSDVMQRDVPTVSDHAPANEALRLMTRDGLGRVIATADGGRMSGIITKTDLMHLIRLRSAGWDIGYPRPSPTASHTQN